MIKEEINLDDHDTRFQIYDQDRNDLYDSQVDLLAPSSLKRVNITDTNTVRVNSTEAYNITDTVTAFVDYDGTPVLVNQTLVVERERERSGRSFRDEVLNVTFSYPKMTNSTASVLIQNGHESKWLSCNFGDDRGNGGWCDGSIVIKGLLFIFWPEADYGVRTVQVENATAAESPMFISRYNEVDKMLERFDMIDRMSEPS